MPGTGRLRGRGVPVATSPVPRQAVAHPLVLPFRIVAVLAAQLFDLATFMLMVGRHGIAAEMNPIVGHSFAAFGMPLVALLKFALVLLLASTIVILDPGRPGRRRIPGLAALIAVLAVVGGLVGGISNAIAL